MTARVVSVNLSEKKGTAKQPAAAIELMPGLGVRGDAHMAPGDRQVSLLAREDIERAREQISSSEGCELKAEKIEIAYGTFAENITTEGLDLPALEIGTVLKLGKGVRLRVSKIGKDCPRPCAIYYRTGDCIMPKRGIFAEVIEGGVVRPGDEIETG